MSTNSLPSRKLYSVIELRELDSPKALYVGVSSLGVYNILQYGAKKFKVNRERIIAYVHYYTDNLLEANRAKWHIAKKLLGDYPKLPYGKGITKFDIEQSLKERPVQLRMLGIRVDYFRLLRAVKYKRNIDRYRDERLKIVRHRDSVRASYNVNSYNAIMKSHKAYKNSIDSLVTLAEGASGFKKLVYQELCIAAGARYKRWDYVLERLRPELDRMLRRMLDLEDDYQEYRRGIQHIQYLESENAKKQYQITLRIRNALNKIEADKAEITLLKRQVDAVKRGENSETTTLAILAAEAERYIARLRLKSTKETYSLQLRRCKTTEQYNHLITVIKALL